MSRNPGRRPRGDGEKSRERSHSSYYDDSPSKASVPIIKPMLLQRRPTGYEHKTLFSSEEAQVSESVSTSRKASLPREAEQKESNFFEKPVKIQTSQVHVAELESSEENQGLKKELPVKLLDEMLVFSNSVMQFLNEQSDFLVVGCIGTQGVGKSHILSSLFQHDRKRKFLFPVQSHEDIENSNHKTSGIDAYITPERVILLDCQPVLSCSVMYSDIQAEWEKKIGFEFGSTEAGAEMNSIQLISFLLSVCHVLLVVQDWTVDLNLLRLIQTAEMLKPSFPPLNQDEPYVEAFPHLAFIFNRASDDDSRTDRRLKLSAMLRSVFSKSNLKVESGISNVQDPPHLPINLSFFGEESQNETEIERFCQAASRLRQTILSTPRHCVSYVSLSEKTWLSYAARVWDTIKKSPLFMEYSRLLP
ncbi:nonsense-mediated mRNA decay factor SMG9-like isoform X2 [Artemia franciscana]|uniref:Protein SMG9 n=1 Tax=Artemia franciscana TaxID=6661 RepID=A0AA88HJS2_ARTSF|nr:hypothetical protein QYM36_012686 [Artemia franciscana]